MASPKALESSLKNLTIHPSPSKSSSSFKIKQKAPIADSWEDEDSSSSSSDTETEQPLSPQASVDYPSAPPPTPISPTTTFSQSTFQSPYGYSIDSIAESRSEAPAKRPEKTNAAAARMIAAGLGVKVKKTEEQRQYDRVVKEKEMKRRREEREREEREKVEKEKAKAAIWSD